jgi:hypothetical protein
MDEHGKKGWPKGFDGRFGKEFDDEVNSGLVVKAILGVALAVVGAILINLTIRSLLAPGEADLGSFQPHAIEGPLLQVDPEGELIAMRREAAAHLGARVGNALPPEGSGWGWVDAGAGIIHLPIPVAMDLFLRRQGGSLEQASTDHDEVADSPAQDAAPQEVHH